MTLTVKKANYGSFIEVQSDETEVTIYKNGNESTEFIQNLLETIEEVCRLREESIYEYLERHYNIKIEEK